MAMQRILITGGAGFIGSHVTEVLLARKHEVVVLDDLSTGNRRNLPGSDPKLRFIEGSILDHAAVELAMEGCHAVIHLAAVASVQASFANPSLTHGVNVAGTLTCLQHARSTGVEKFIFASSAAVYGDVAQGSISEQDLCTPQSPYAVDKLACEMYGRMLASKWGIKFLALRFFNVYGPRQSKLSDYSGVVHKFSEAAMRGAPVRIFGDGFQRRDFVFVRDLADAIYKLLETSPLVEGPLNIGTGGSLSLLELVSVLEEITGRPLEVEHVAALDGDIRHSQADIGALRELGVARAPTSIQEGLSQLIEFLRARTPQAN